jgi:hypothetical protein
MVAPLCGSGEQSESLTGNLRLSAVFSLTAPRSGLLGHRVNRLISLGVEFRVGL